MRFGKFSRRIISVLLCLGLIISAIFVCSVPVAAEETQEPLSETVATKTLYRYREKIETTSRFPLDSPWNLISRTDSTKFLREYSNLDLDELAELEEKYSSEYCYTTKTDDGTICKFSTRPYGGAVYYYEESFLYGPFAMYNESQFTYYEHPITGLKLYLRGVCNTYTLRVNTKYEYRYWKWSEWSAWSETPYTPSDTVEVETKESNILYRYREKEYSTSKSALDDPWILYDTVHSYEHQGERCIYLYYTEEINPYYCVHEKENVNKYVYNSSYFYATESEYAKMYAYSTAHGGAGEIGYYKPKTGYIRYTCCQYKKVCDTTYYYYKWSDWSDWSFTPITENEDVEVETKFATTISISYNANGGVGAPPATSKKFDEIITISTVTPTRENHQFVGWATSEHGEVEYAPGDIYSENVDITFYAVWKNVTEYTVTYNANGGIGAPAKQTKIHAEPLTISSSVPTREGYVFLGWSTTSTGNVEYPIGSTYENDKSITMFAVWSKNEYIIAYNANGGVNAPEFQIKTYGDNLVLSFAKPTREGYTFLGWSAVQDGQVEYLPGDIYCKDASALLYAVWAGNTVTLTFDANGGNNAPDPITVSVGSRITLPDEVPVRDGFTFLGWSTDRSGSTYSTYGNGYEILSNWRVSDGGIGFYTPTYWSSYEGTTDLTLYAIWRIDDSSLLGNKCGDNLYWTYDADTMHLSITGYGAMYNFSNSDLLSAVPPWDTYMTNIKTVSLSEGITSIGNYAFAYSTVREINFPDSLVSIGVGAFMGDSGLKTLVIPSSIKQLCHSAFSNCNYLTDVTIECDGLLDENIFNGCDRLSNIVITGNITRILSGVFADCNSNRAMDFELPGSLTWITASAIKNKPGMHINYDGTKRQWEKLAGSKLLNTTVYCKQYELSYDSTEGDTSLNTQIGIKGSPIVISGETPNRPHYVFVGWNDNNTDTIYAPCSEYSATDDTTLYALWIYEGCINGHTATTDEAVPTSCAETGLTEGSHCSLCGEILVAQESVEILSHSYGVWIGSDSEKHQRICVCGKIETGTHYWDDGKITTQPTHITYGECTYTCQYCSATKAEQVVKTTEHSYGVWTNEDTTHHVRICECGQVETQAHNWNNSIITIVPTHTSTGELTYVCADCGAVKTESIDIVPHVYGAWSKVDNEVHKRVCDCGDIQTTSHNWDDGTLTTYPTHTTFGERTYICEDCSATKTEEIAKTTEHSYSSWVKVDGEKHQRTCACGDVETDTHNWDEGVITTKPTHTTFGERTYTCDDCSATKIEEIAKITEHSYSSWTKVDEETHQRTCICGDIETDTHNWDEGVITTKPTHTTFGERTYTCDDCSATKTEEIAKITEHSYSSWAKVDAETHQRTCICGDIETDTHNWDDGTLTTYPTHTTFGERTYICEDCSATKTEEIAKTTEHSYSSWVKVDGEKHQRTCACGDVETDTHNWDEGVITTKPTHTTFGERTYTCDDCSATKIEEIAKITEHSYSSWTKVDEETHQRTCICGDIETDTHNWDEGVITTKPTHTTFGECTYTCDDCSATKTEQVAKTTEHSYSSWTKVDAETHKRTCACGSVETKSHSWDDGIVTTHPTHTTFGECTYTCDDCSATKTEHISKTTEHFYSSWAKVDAETHQRTCICGDIETDTHNWDEGVITTKPTHTTFGERTYTCDDCSATKTEEIAKITEHSYSSWTKVDEETHQRTCICGDIETDTHNWDGGVITTKPTHTTFGECTYTCDDCSATKTEQVAKTTEHSYSSWTKVDAETHKRTCACGSVETKAHSWDDGIVTTHPTHTTFGECTYTCDDCSATKTEQVAKTTEHSYGSWMKVDAENHQRICICGDIEAEAHSWDDGVITTYPTHTTLGERTYTCKDCTATKTEKIAKVTEHSYSSWTKVDEETHQRTCICGDIETDTHNWDNGEITKEATCKTTGVKTYTCSVCKGAKNEILAIEKVNHTEGEWIIITTATCTEDGVKEQRCSVCNELLYTESIPSTGHQYGDWIVTKEPTITEAGEKSCECSVCHDVKTETIEPIEMLGLLGDANGDGKVNVKDATAIQKHLAGLITLTDEGLTLADADGSRKVNIKDATAIQKHIAGMDTGFIIETPISIKSATEDEVAFVDEKILLY